MNAFDEWVAQTIFSISGIWPTHPCDMQHKRALTFYGSRMPACQWVCDDYFDPIDLGNMLASARVLANFTLRGQNQGRQSLMSAVSSGCALRYSHPQGD